MCTVGFQGMGYSPDFVQNYQTIKDQITESPETLLQVHSRTDEICRPCPHNLEKGFCEKEEKIQSLDARHKLALELQEGQILSWNEGLNRIKTHMTFEKFHASCEGCEWKSLGVCEVALSKILSGALTPS
ncbi:DUF1284 domain-containing protein [Candidatus Bealeia paramacronuclearis]|uniref:DUF1284 domain-containing protein n=2 Tax=Candidatus Bealeia paramacronuclearis TaxID=1921001 RepID=A0ABZ2C7S1_9PROT|nr:hypothetical protein [Candidatus Bealeia paramacronuclearis]